MGEDSKIMGTRSQKRKIIVRPRKSYMDDIGIARKNGTEMTKLRTIAGDKRDCWR